MTQKKIGMLSDAAKESGVTKQWVWAIRLELQELGLVEISGHRITVTDIDAAVEYVVSGRKKNRAARLARKQGGKEQNHG